MIRRTALRLLMGGAIGLAAGAAPAGPVDDIIAEIRAQGFEILRVDWTLLGRVRIVAQNATHRREVVIDPTTGEIRRDLLTPRRRGSRPNLGAPRDIGPIGEEPAPPAEGDEDLDSGWGGGWGGPDAPAEGGAQGEGDTDAR